MPLPVADKEEKARGLKHESIEQVIFCSWGATEGADSGHGLVESSA